MIILSHIKMTQKDFLHYLSNNTCDVVNISSSKHSLRKLHDMTPHPQGPRLIS
jgi:hypothetical protein